MEVAEDLKRNARRLLSDRQPLSALPITEVLCSLQPSDLEVQQLRALTLYEVREFDNVLRVVEELLSHGGNDPDSITLAMKAAFELGDNSRCRKFGELLISLNKHCCLALCYMGKSAELAGDTEQAISHYRNALDNDPYCGEAFSALIDRRLMSGKELRAVVDSLRFPPEAEVLRKSYRARILTKFDEYDDFEFEEDGIPRKLLLLRLARQEYEKNNLRQSLSLTIGLLEQDPFDRDVVCLHLCVLVDLKVTPKIFETAHYLSKSKSQSELAVYAIGCYYYSLSSYEQAGRYFCRATELDCYFAEAWIAYAHCCAKLEEGERALNIYRGAMNLFPGLGSCATFLGMQYSMMHQWPVAMCFFKESLEKNSKDSLVLNEIAVIYLHAQKLQEAARFLKLAHDCLPNSANPDEHHDCILFNYATVLRKLGEYDLAIKLFSQYVTCRPNAGYAYCALGFAHHLAGNIKCAIAHYHTSLSIKPDTFCTEMLDRALTADFGQDVVEINWGTVEDQGSPQANDVSFSAASTKLRAESTTTESTTGSPRMSVGRSLNF